MTVVGHRTLETIGLNFSSRVQIFGAKMENMLQNQTDQREVYILISLSFIILFKRARRARVILLQRLISQKIQRRRRAAFSQFLTIFAWRQQQRPKRVAWVLPRPQYWLETLFNSNALKENLRVSRKTFNFICDSTR